MTSSSKHGIKAGTVSSLTTALVAQVRARLQAGAGFAVATLNLDHAVKLRRDRRFAAAYARHDMVVADGRPIVWLSWLGGRRVGLTPGSEMIVPLCEVARDLGVGIALVGSTDAILKNAGSKRSRRSLKFRMPH